MRLKFLWDATLERNVSLKSDWGCVWFQRTTSVTSTTRSLATPKSVRRGGSLLVPDRQLLEIERTYDPTQSLSRIRVSITDARRTTTGRLEVISRDFERVEVLDRILIDISFEVLLGLDRYLKKCFNLE